MTNESLLGLCKLGHVHVPNKSSQTRAKELSNTSIPTDFKVAYDIKVKNPSKYERIIHNKLNEFRQNDRKEFFKCNPEDIMDYFKLENLITCEEDKKDFPDNYFRLHVNGEYNEIDDDVVVDDVVVDIADNDNDKDKIDYDVIDNNNCTKCGKEFKYKYLLKRHHESKFSCNSPNKLLILHNNKIKEFDVQIQELDDKITLIENKINNINTKSLKKLNICLFCNKTFLNKTNMTRHIDKSCAKKKELLKQQNIILDEKNNIIIEKNKLIQEKKEQTIKQERDNEIKEFKELKAMVYKLLKR
jgi:hypothetical protein